MMQARHLVVYFAVLGWTLFVTFAAAFAPTFHHHTSFPSTAAAATTTTTTTHLSMVAVPKNPKYKKKGYDPKWKKKATIAEQEGASAAIDPTKVGLKGDIPIVFRQGNATKTTMAYAGQPLRDVATQAGQFIKYGCGKGECGTCECLVNGQWIRPCSATVPAMPVGETYTIQVKEIKSKTVSSGKFYTVRSIVLGFWNNLLGMVGFVKGRRAAKKNWDERREYEELIRQKTLEKKRKRLEQEQQANGKLSP